VKHIVQHGFQQLEILRWHEAPDADAEGVTSQTLTFADTLSALTYLRRFAGDPVRMKALRRWVLTSLPYPDVSRKDDQAIVRLVAGQVACGRLKLVWRERISQHTAFGAVGSDAQPEAQAEDLVEETPPAETQPLNWVEFRFVDDETGDALSDIELKLKLPDGQVKSLKTNSDGAIRLTNLVAGTVDIEDIISDDTLEIVQVE